MVIVELSLGCAGLWHERKASILSPLEETQRCALGRMEAGPSEDALELSISQRILPGRCLESSFTSDKSHAVSSLGLVEFQTYSEVRTEAETAQCSASDGNLV